MDKHEWPKHPAKYFTTRRCDQGLINWMSQNKAMAVCLAAVIVIILVKYT